MHFWIYAATLQLLAIMHRKSADEQAKKVDVRVQLNVDTDDIPGRFFFQEVNFENNNNSRRQKTGFSTHL